MNKENKKLLRIQLYRGLIYLKIYRLYYHNYNLNHEKNYFRNIGLFKNII